jgi:ABC-type branched-subunit amino acid transport system ATPase component
MSEMRNVRAQYYRTLNLEVAKKRLSLVGLLDGNVEYLHVCVCGAQGAGKTTLCRALVNAEQVSDTEEHDLSRC